MKTLKLTKKQWEIIQTERKAAKIKAFNDDKNIFTDIIPALFDLQKQERRLQKLAELECNGYPKPVTEYRDGKMFQYSVEDMKLRERSEKRAASIEAYVIGVAKFLNMAVDFQGDPRGLMFSLRLPDGTSIEVA